MERYVKNLHHAARQKISTVLLNIPSDLTYFCSFAIMLPFIFFYFFIYLDSIMQTQTSFTLMHSASDTLENRMRFFLSLAVNQGI